MKSLLRHAWMDLVSATGFLAVFLFRERFERDTLVAVLLWPVVFEIMLAFALTIASAGNGLRRDLWRNLWFALVAAIYLGLAWLGGARSELPWLWFAALWLLVARARPPAGLPVLGPTHRRWLFSSALPASAIALVPAVLVYLLLLALPFGDCDVNAAGERVCESPAWTFAVVWVPYFVVEALTRAHTIAALPAAAATRR